MIFFTADQHYGHKNIITYCNRPFASSWEMDEALIANHNKVVHPKDTVIHAGDFTLSKDRIYITSILRRLNGTHVFLRGSHDKWLDHAAYIWERSIEGQYVVVCHYAMRTWARSHYNSWQLYGHSHGKLPPIGKQWDIGVDNNNFFPISFSQVKEIMKTREDNPNYLKKRG
jgi:calcineurin-like phosphoesterase family protein